MDNPIVLKIFLIGFHHTKGWLTDFEYPEKGTNKDEQDFDEERLPTLCLPDQSHNFTRDSVYFILPNSSEEKRIFGVSCFRQIETEKLINRTENDGSEFSRSSVQKAVCCLSRLPLFGYIEVKLNIIVDKIFEQGDFSCNELLRESYNELNRCLLLRTEVCVSNEIFISSHDDFINDFYIGICLRELIGLWKHKVLMLFKLFLLERRIIFYGTPTKPLCNTILSIISLHPHLLNKGFCNGFEPKMTFPSKKEDYTKDDDEKEQNDEKSEKTEDEEKSQFDEMDGPKQTINLPNIDPSEWFAPMNIFKNGYLCLPYISLHYMDIISDKSHNGFIVGASNVLFQQKKHLVDVLIDVPTQGIEFIDLELKKCVQLTTEDLRFFEHLTKGIESPKCDDYQTGTDQWIRKQFESYFTSMLRTNYASESNQRDLESFNEFFMDAWKKSNNYQDWLAKKITFSSAFPEGNSFDKFPQTHPFARTNNNVINVSDVKNKIVQSINNTPSARKTVTAVSNTFSNAKSTFSSWLSNLSVKEELPKDIMTMDERDGGGGGDNNITATVLEEVEEKTS